MVDLSLIHVSAARELYCTQPALSYQIRNLETELDLALFTRSTTRVALTEACLLYTSYRGRCPAAASFRLILPGVGAFADAMAKLEATGLVPVMKEAVSYTHLDVYKRQR